MQTTPIVFDMDDTLFDTRAEMVACFAEFGHDLRNVPGYVTKHNAPEEILVSVLGRARFMTTGKMFDGAFDLLKRLVHAGADVRICTHRGYHADGLKHTHTQLFEHKILNTLIPEHHVYCLDPAQHKDKFAFLDAELKSPYVLIDDNPDLSGDRGRYGSLVVFDRPWNQESLIVPRIMGYDTGTDAFLMKQLDKAKRRQQCQMV
jgi:hypothetical protein